MIRSMFTAINSMYLNQQYLDVVADNLSNVNTPGFKSSFVRFKDQFAQSISVGGASAVDTEGLGGTNPMQIGLGTNMGTVGKSFSQGALTSTGNDLDMAISGDGFFVYDNGVTNVYSRDGSLSIDSQGFLVHSSSGDKIQGWMADGLGTVDVGSTLENIKLPINSTVARSTTSANILGNLNSATAIPIPTQNIDLTAELYRSAATGFSTDTDIIAQDSAGTNREITLTFTKTANANEWAYSAASTNPPATTDPVSGSGLITFDPATGLVNSVNGTAVSTDATRNFDINYLSEAINVNLGDVTQPTSGIPNNVVSNVTDGTASGTYDVTMGVYDEIGYLTPVVLRFSRTTDANTWNYSISPNDTSNADLVNTSGTTIPVGTIVFDGKGQWVSDSGNVWVPGSSGSLTPTRVDLNLDGMTMLDTANSVALGSQNGLAAGSLMGFTVSSNTGEIYGTYSNGDQRLIGQLALATFVNSSGLVRDGGNNYVAGLNSGEAMIGAPSSGGRGTVASGYVEGSNVDMSREFSNMILAQRGFQASSRIINASDEILQELVNLGR